MFVCVILLGVCLLVRFGLYVLGCLVNSDCCFVVLVLICCLVFVFGFVWFVICF